MSSFHCANAFADPEDSQLVADAKNSVTEPVPYTYTEVATHFLAVSIGLNITYVFLERCHLVQSWNRGYGEGAEMDV